MKIWVKLTFAIWLMLVVFWTGLIFWESQVNRQTAIEQAKSFSLSMHESTLAGLTGMMITGTIGQREVLLDQIKQLAVIRDLSVIRGAAVTRLYGPGTAKDQLPRDQVEEQVLATGREFVEVQSDASGEFLRVVRPAKASKNYLGKDCIECHQVPEGTVLGAIAMKISLDQVNAAVSAQRLKSLLAALVLSLPLLAFIYLFIRNVVTKPLEQMVDGLRDIAKGEGDLTRRLEVRSGDEIGAAATAFNDMMAKMAALVRHVSHSASEVSVAARELVASADRVNSSSRLQNETSLQATDSVERMVAAGKVQACSQSWVVCPESKAPHNAAPSRAASSLRITRTGTGSSKARVRPLSRNASRKAPPRSLGSNFGAMPPPTNMARVALSFRARFPASAP